MKIYTLKFLDSDSFDKLPYSGAIEALGVADQSAGIAYVRDNQNPLDVFTAIHELEHLKGDDLDEHATPGEPGVYYKKAKDWILPAIAAASFLIPGVGPAIGGALGSVGAAGGGALTSLGLGGIASGLAPIGSALSGAGASFAGAGKAAQGALGGLFGSGTAASNAGYASNAGRIGSSMGGGFGVGTGTGAGSAAASGGGGGAISGLLSDFGKSGAQSFVKNTLSGKPKQQSSEYPEYMDRFQGQGIQQQQEPQQPPAVSQVGGKMDSLGSDYYRNAMQQRRSGFYSGRDAGGL